MYKSISVIIPFYYGNKYMKSLFERLSRNYKVIDSEFFMEVIVVNDSPKDDVNVEQSNYEFPIHIIVNEKNIGIHGSRKKGLAESKSDVVLFLDQDDEISENCILSQMHALADNDFVIGNGYVEESNGGLKKIYNSRLQQKMCLNGFFHYAYTNPIISPGQVVIKRKAIPDNWISYTFNNNGADDHYLWLLILANKATGAVNYDCIYTHKYTGSNASLNRDNMYASNMEMIERLKQEVRSPQIKLLERRIKYYKCTSKLRKIKYIDVCLLRFFVRLILFHGKDTINEEI